MHIYLIACPPPDVSVCHRMTFCFRYTAWGKKSSGKLKSAPKLKSLPPTNEAFELNVMRAHFQCAVWLYSLQPDPPSLDPTEYGWETDELNEMLVPMMLPKGVEPIPRVVLKMVACNCKAEKPCGQGNCTCKKHKMACSLFCRCQGGSDCCSPFTPNFEEVGFGEELPDVLNDE